MTDQVSSTANAADVSPGRPVNPPQMDQLAFRIATQPVFRDWMLKRLRRNSIPFVEGQLPNPLLALHTEDPEGFIYALISAWAAIGDNLTFYQERIANEGFLRTAVEEFSVRALIASVGSFPRPALSAQSALAFTLIKQLSIPKGTAVQSVPLPGQIPVVFETDEDIEAKPEWNELRLRLPVPQLRPAIESGVTTRLRVASLAKSLRPGTPIIVIPGNFPDASPCVRMLTTVEPDTKRGFTTVGWVGPIVVDGGKYGVADFQICSQSGKLFGAGAPAWAQQSDQMKAAYGQRVGAVTVSADAGSAAESIGRRVNDALQRHSSARVVCARGARFNALRPSWSPHRVAAS